LLCSADWVIPDPEAAIRNQLGGSGGGREDNSEKRKSKKERRDVASMVVAREKAWV
jgi:hypothetical protein